MQVWHRHRSRDVPRSSHPRLSADSTCSGCIWWMHLVEQHRRSTNHQELLFWTKPLQSKVFRNSVISGMGFIGQPYARNRFKQKKTPRATIGPNSWMSLITASFSPISCQTVFYRCSIIFFTLVVVCRKCPRLHVDVENQPLWSRSRCLISRTHLLGRGAFAPLLIQIVCDVKPCTNFVQTFNLQK